jgi:hypothetical protein
MSDDKKKKDVVNDLLEQAELDRVLLDVMSASDEDIAKDLAKEGHTPEKIAAVFEGHKKLVAKAPPPRKTGPVVYIGAGVIGGLAIAAAVAAIWIANREEHPIATGGEASAPVTAVTGSPNDADTLRGRAFRACSNQRWDECLDLFDQAKALDPKGDADKDVQGARTVAKSSMKK